MPGIAQAYTLFIEGIVQIIIGMILMIFVLRRGKNRMLSALAWFFLAVGIFSLGPFLPSAFQVIPGLSILIAYSSVVCHTSVFFGVAGYCGAQFGLLKGPKTVRIAFVVGFLIALLLVIFHALSLPSVSADPRLRLTFAQISEWAMFGFFVVSLALIMSIFFSIAWQLRREKGALNYAAATGLGLTLLLAALTIRKALDTMMPNLWVDFLTFLSLAFVVVGVTYQTSASMSPGIVYDSKSKKPIARAFVRLIRTSYNKLIESRITGPGGRYGLLVEPGRYKINVIASGFAEYNSEEFEVSKPTLVGKDIPLTEQAAQPAIAG